MLATEKLILKFVCRPFSGRHVLCGGQLGPHHCLGVHWVVFLFIYCLMWGALWVRSLGLGWLLLGLVVILIAWLMRTVRLPVPIRRKRSARMLILSGRLI